MSTTTQQLGNPSDPYKAANVDHATLDEKVQDLITFVEKNKFCLLATRVAGSNSIATRCMAIAGKEHNSIDWVFHANLESGKTDDLKSDPDVNLGFLNPSGEWASISGTADVVTDGSEIKKFYSPALKAWIGDLEDGVHDGGPEDPRVCLIKVKTVTAQYSVARKGIIGSAIEVAKGIVDGNPPKINKLRHLDQGEIEQWRERKPSATS